MLFSVWEFPSNIFLVGFHSFSCSNRNISPAELNRIESEKWIINKKKKSQNLFTRQDRFRLAINFWLAFVVTIFHLCDSRNRQRKIKTTRIRKNGFISLVIVVGRRSLKQAKIVYFRNFREKKNQ